MKLWEFPICIVHICCWDFGLWRYMSPYVRSLVVVFLSFLENLFVSGSVCSFVYVYLPLFFFQVFFFCFFSDMWCSLLTLYAHVYYHDHRSILAKWYRVVLVFIFKSFSLHVKHLFSLIILLMFFFFKKKMLSDEEKCICIDWELEIDR